VAKPKKNQNAEAEALPMVERELKVELTPAQAKERMSEAFDLQTTIDAAAKEILELKEAHKAQLEALQDTVKQGETRKSQLCRGISLVKCEPVKNYDSKMIEYWYPSFAHGKKYDEVPFSAEDHQKRMFQEQADAIPATGANPLESEGARA
jgi:hypothetical protein